MANASNSWIDADFPVELVCPRDHTPLVPRGEALLQCSRGHEFPVSDRIPVVLLADELQTIGVAECSWKRARGEISGDPRAPDLFLESLGISEDEKNQIVALRESSTASVDSVVQMLIGATCGMAYKRAMGRLHDYPIPQLPLSPGEGRVLLDVGCNWGRWSIGAARLGYRPVGCDPQLGAIAAARRVAQQLGIAAEYLCADARWLPLPDASVDVVLSYSVLQHMSSDDAERTISEMGRVLKPGGLALVQMANSLGLRSIFQMARRGFRSPLDFEVRYRAPGPLLKLFSENIGSANIEPDCYFGLGLQPSDRELMGPIGRTVLAASEMAKRVARSIPVVELLADSVWVRALKQPARPCR